MIDDLGGIGCFHCFKIDLKIFAKLYKAKSFQIRSNVKPYEIIPPREFLKFKLRTQQGFTQNYTFFH